MFIPHMSNLMWLPMFIFFNTYLCFCFSIMILNPEPTKNNNPLITANHKQKWPW